MNELAKNLRCLIARGSIEIWLEQDKVESVLSEIERGKKFIQIGEEVINTFEILGVFTPQQIEERNRRKNGEWKCEDNRWHSKGEKCECWRAPKVFISPKVEQNQSVI